MVEIVASHAMKLETEDDIIAVRRRVKELAEHRKFDTFAIAAITTAASELARNVIVHGRGGDATVDEVTDGARAGIRITFTDQGPGIPDVARVMTGGFSTARSMGLGLSGSKRLVDAFELDSKVGHGTRVCVTKWKRY